MSTPANTHYASALRQQPVAKKGLVPSAPIAIKRPSNPEPADSPCPPRVVAKLNNSTSGNFNVGYVEVDKNAGERLMKKDEDMFTADNPPVFVDPIFQIPVSKALNFKQENGMAELSVGYFMNGAEAYFSEPQVARLFEMQEYQGTPKCRAQVRVGLQKEELERFRTHISTFAHEHWFKGTDVSEIEFRAATRDGDLVDVTWPMQYDRESHRRLPKQLPTQLDTLHTCSMNEVNEYLKTLPLMKLKVLVNVWARKEQGTAKMVVGFYYTAQEFIFGNC